MDISVVELKERMDNGENLFIIDVREPAEYAEFNIGGQNIPLGLLISKLYDFDDKLNDEIIVHCRSGARSGSAKGLLEQSGFKNVRNLTGGMLEWQAKFVP